MINCSAIAGSAKNPRPASACLSGPWASCSWPPGPGGDEMSYMPIGETIKCPVLDCAAGMGLAGMGVCFMDGEWDNPDCSQYCPENAFLLDYYWSYHFEEMGYGGEVEQEWPR